MATLKEKLDELRLLRRTHTENPLFSALMNAEGDLSRTVAGKAYWNAVNAVSEIGSELYEAERELRKAQESVDAINQRLVVAEHSVATLGAVEVP